jgi:hypothetical protein
VRQEEGEKIMFNEADENAAGAGTLGIYVDETRLHH